MRRRGHQSWFPVLYHRSFWRGPGKLVTSAQATLKFILAIVR
jgi:hypothetical protein